MLQLEFLKPVVTFRHQNSHSHVESSKSPAMPVRNIFDLADDKDQRQVLTTVAIEIRSDDTGRMLNLTTIFDVDVFADEDACMRNLLLDPVCYRLRQGDAFGHGVDGERWAEGNAHKDERQHVLGSVLRHHLSRAVCLRFSTLHKCPHTDTTRPENCQPDNYPSLDDIAETCLNSHGGAYMRVQKLTDEWVGDYR